MADLNIWLPVKITIKCYVYVASQSYHTMKTEEASPVRKSKSVERKQSMGKHSGQLGFVLG